jgi:quercetin 2,3-dioxygenase
MKKISIRKSAERGYFDHGWLKSFHSFSFAEYFDRNHMNFHSLRVINEDFIKPQNGFGFHPHKDMEIITYVMRGALTHEDNLGNKEEIKAGEFQVMSAGTGIIHSEFNHGLEEVHLLQIWIKPNVSGGIPGYKISAPNHFEKWALIASNDGRSGSFSIKQNAEIYAINSGNLKEISLPQSNLIQVWIQVAQGSIKMGDFEINAGDGISFSKITSEKTEKITFNETSKIILFALS